MTTLKMIKGRIRRKLVKELSGDNYISGDEILESIPYLQQFSDEQFLFGIKDSVNKWTVLSVNKLFAQYHGDPFSITLNDDADKIHDFYGKEGHKHKVDVVLDEKQRIWMKSEALSYSIQNIVMHLQKLPDRAYLEP